jgi:A/G-specific adenine glycosylase
MKTDAITPESRSTVREALLGHYDRTSRALPWRRDSDPYRVLVSEIMLQQTRVETVTGYYGRWLESFPGVDALAAADEDEVLEAWEGLGYYRRALNLHRAARVVREEYAGVIPPTYDALRELPGVGAYTAGAVASIAFGERVPAVDGNVRRVLARLFDVAEPKAAWLRGTAAELVDEDRPGDWNEALMELGATVCTPRAPGCGRCPIARWCAASAAGTQSERPAAATRREVPSAEIVLAVLHRDGEVLVAKRPSQGLLAGMWAFPERSFDGGSAPDLPGAAVEIAESLGLRPVSRPERLPECRHRFTHLAAMYIPWSVEVAGEPDPSGRTKIEWMDPADTSGRALPVAQRKVLDSWRRRRTTEAL